jgi:hypothetical protein
MKTEIQVIIRNVYGNQTIYPMCEQGKKLASLAGHKTLTDRDITIIKSLGFTIKIVTEHPVSL